MNKVLLSVLFTLYSIFSVAQNCGNCNIPDCEIGQYVTYSQSEINHTNHCVDLSSSPIAGPTTYRSFHQVTSDANGKVALVFSTTTTGGCSISYDFEMFLLGGACLFGWGNTPINLNANGSPNFNPEWDGLNPNTNYLIAISYDIPAGCSLEGHCQAYYEPTPPNQDCGDCLVANCVIGSAVDYTSSTYSVCNDPNPNIIENTFTSCHTANSGNNGTLGFSQEVTMVSCTESDLTQSYELKLSSNGSCSGSAIPVSTVNANNLSSGINPEWYGLIENQDYVFCLTTDVPQGCELDKNCIDFYNPAAPCDAIIGSTKVEINGVDVTNSISNEYELCWEDQIDITAENFTFPTYSGASNNPDLGFIVYNSVPSNPVDDYLNDPAYTGTIKGPQTFSMLNDGSEISLLGSSNEMYLVPAIFINYDGVNYTALATCFEYGSTLKITFLNEITYVVTDQCGGTTDIQISGGHPEFFGSNYQLTGIIPASSYASNNTPSHQEIFNLSPLTNGVNYGIAVNDANSCQLDIDGIYNQPQAYFSIDNPITINNITDCITGVGSATATLTGADGTEVVSWVDSASGNSIGSNLSINNLNEGTYYLNVTGNGCTESDTVRILNTNVPISIGVSETDESCSLNDGMIEILVFSGGVPSYTYSLDNGVNYQSGNIFSSLNEGVYTVTVKDANNCIGTQQAVVAKEPNCPLPCYTPIVNIPDTLVLCGSPTLLISPQIQTNLPPTYLWNTSETTSEITVSSAGDYWIQVTDDTCSFRKNIHVTEEPGFSFDGVVVDETCIGAFDGKININISGSSLDYDFLWSTGETLPFLTGLMPGVYTVSVTDINNCTITETYTVSDAKDICNEVIPHVFIPSAFSPNHDGENDILYVRGEGVASIEFEIYDRLGQKVFETEDINEGWNGENMKGQMKPSGVYTYRINVTYVNRVEEVRYGNITLVR